MFKTLVNAWKIDDLRKKILFTLFIVLLYRVGVAIPIPYLAKGVLEDVGALSDGIFGFLNILSGSAFSQATLFALGVSPYITASIVMQLLTIAIPALERMAKDGQEGQKKITQITRYVTVILSLITAIGYYMLLKNQTPWLTDTSFFAAVVIVSCYCAGSSLVMWLAEKVNEHGIGNGISMILLANIISSLPTMVVNMVDSIIKGALSVKIFAALGLLITVGMIVFVVFMHDSERRLPIQYAKKVVGRKQYGGQNSNLPIKLTMTGVMPVIFANSIITIPATIDMFVNQKPGGFWDGFFGLFSPNSWFYAVLTFFLIVAFAYFYAAISFNPIEIANNLKKNGGFIPGIRPGKPTSDYISKVTNRIILIGALMLSIIAIVPMILNIVSGGSLGMLSFSGNSIIIVVGVILETTREIESQMSVRHYKGFLE